MDNWEAMVSFKLGSHRASTRKVIFEQSQKKVRKHLCQFPRKKRFRYKANASSVHDQNKVRGLKGSGVPRDQFRYDIGHYHMLLFFKSVEILRPCNHTLFSVG